MYIKNLEIKNFRQLKGIKINFDKEVNILAGSNNSGKTSILELYNIMFNKNEFAIDDLNNECRVNITNLIEKFISEQDENEKIKIKESILSQKIEIYLTIEYFEEDNISLQLCQEFRQFS